MPDAKTARGNECKRRIAPNFTLALDMPAPRRHFGTMLDRQTKPPLTIRLCQPRGFCAGVDRAIQIVVLALKKYGAPVYVRHEIVHNRYVVEGLQKLGAVFIEDLSEIPPEHQASPVVFSAHGVPKSVPADAQARNLFYLDATCPLVSKVHKQAMRHQRLGRHVLLIGHAGHPEVIGTMGQLPEGDVTLIENEADVAALRAGRSGSARFRHPDHAVGRGHGRHHPGAAGKIPADPRASPPNRSATPPPTARRR